MTEDDVLFWNCHLLGVKKNLSHPHQTGSWYLLGGSFQNFPPEPHPFYMGLITPPRHKGHTGKYCPKVVVVRTAAMFIQTGLNANIPSTV